MPKAQPPALPLNDDQIEAQPEVWREYFLTLEAMGDRRREERERLERLKARRQASKAGRRRR